MYCCRRVCVYTLQPENVSGWGSEGVNLELPVCFMCPTDWLVDWLVG